MKKIISEQSLYRRRFWVEEIKKLSGNFIDDYTKLETELKSEIHNEGVLALIDHLRLCGSIPEAYNHDSSEEKLYSKYTDCLLSLSFQAIGLKSLVLTERADSADVEAFGNGYSFIADAKSFRLSRTAKNQKDFKVQAMHSWKRDKLNAMIVCPIYQLPNSSSQIYKQATVNDVCVFTFSHLALILCFSEKEGKDKAQELLYQFFKTVPLLNPSKSATDYWLAINRTMLAFSKDIEQLWTLEKQASSESIEIAKNEDLTYLAQQREKIMRLNHEEALNELIRVHKIDNKIRIINSISDNGIFTIK